MNNPSESILLTDLYMLTMLEGFYKQGMDGVASYQFFVRHLPPNRGFLVAAGIAMTATVVAARSTKTG